MKRGIHLPIKLKQIFTALLFEHCVFVGKGPKITTAKAVSRCFNHKHSPETECMSLTTALKLPGYLDTSLSNLYRYLHNYCHIKIDTETFLKCFKQALEEYNAYCTTERDTGRMDCFYYGTWRGMTVVINGTKKRELAQVLSISDREFATTFQCVTMGQCPVTFDVLNLVLKQPYTPYQVVDRDTGHRIDLTIDPELITKYFQSVKLKV